MTSTPPPPTASRLRYRRTTRWFRPVTVVEVLDDSASDWIDAWGQPRRDAPVWRALTLSEMSLLSRRFTGLPQ